MRLVPQKICSFDFILLMFVFYLMVYSGNSNITLALFV